MPRYSAAYSSIHWTTWGEHFLGGRGDPGAPPPSPPPSPPPCITPCYEIVWRRKFHRLQCFPEQKHMEGVITNALKKAIYLSRMTRSEWILKALNIRCSPQPKDILTNFLVACGPVSVLLAFEGDGGEIGSLSSRTAFGGGGFFFKAQDMKELYIAFSTDDGWCLERINTRV